MAAEKIHAAMDLKEAASLKDPFTAHMAGPDKEELMKIDQEVEGEFESPRPTHDKIEKLLSLKESFGRAAHVEVTPEDGLWRAEMDDAVRAMDQSA